jgi:hypothetical protein
MSNKALSEVLSIQIPISFSLGADELVTAVVFPPVVFVSLLLQEDKITRVAKAAIRINFIL